MECPSCKKPLPTGANSQSAPFCSMRCKAVDLGKWISEDYTISTPLFPSAEPNQSDDSSTDGVKNGNEKHFH